MESIWKHCELPRRQDCTREAKSVSNLLMKVFTCLDQIMGTGVWPNPNETAWVRNSYCTCNTEDPNTRHVYCPKDTPHESVLAPACSFPTGHCTLNPCSRMGEKETKPWYQARGYRLQHVKAAELLHNWEISKALCRCKLARSGINSINLMSSTREAGDSQFQWKETDYLKPLVVLKGRFSIWKKCLINTLLEMSSQYCLVWCCFSSICAKHPAVFPHQICFNNFSKLINQFKECYFVYLLFEECFVCLHAR